MFLGRGIGRRSIVIMRLPPSILAKKNFLKAYRGILGKQLENSKILIMLPDICWEMNH